MDDKRILAIGANPCLERVLTFDNLEIGEVCRAKSVRTYAAGKAANFCRALKCLGGIQGRQLTFLGGDTGKAAAEDFTAAGIEFRAVETPHNTRTCINCVCNGVMTELVEPGHAIEAAELKKYFAMLDENIADAAGVAICGSIPAGTPPDFAVNTALAAQAAGLPLLLDNWECVPAVLETGVKAVLKINEEELSRLTGLGELQAGLQFLKERWPQLTAGITAGAGAAWLVDPLSEGFISFSLPRLAKVVNPLGCGDTASAVFLSRLLSGFPAADAFADALAAASANCLTPEAGIFDPAEALKLLPKRNA